MLCNRFFLAFPSLLVMNHDSSDEGQYPIPDMHESIFFAPLPGLRCIALSLIHFGRSRWQLMASTTTCNMWNINNSQCCKRYCIYMLEITINSIINFVCVFVRFFGLGHLIPVSIASLSLGQKFNPFAF